MSSQYALKRQSLSGKAAVSSVSVGPDVEVGEDGEDREIRLGDGARK